MKFQVHLQTFVGQQTAFREYLRSDALQDGQPFRHLHLQRETVIHRSVGLTLALIHTVSIIARHHGIQRRTVLLYLRHLHLLVLQPVEIMRPVHKEHRLHITDMQHRHNDIHRGFNFVDQLHTVLPYAYRLRRYLLIERSTCSAG